MAEFAVQKSHEHPGRRSQLEVERSARRASRKADRAAFSTNANASGIVQGVWQWIDNDKWWEESNTEYLYDPDTAEWHWGDDNEPVAHVHAWYRQQLLNVMNQGEVQEYLNDHPQDVLEYFAFHPDDADRVRDYLDFQTIGLARNDEIDEIEDDEDEVFDYEDENAHVAEMPDDGAAQPVAVLAENDQFVASGGAGPCVVVMMRVTSTQNRTFLGSIHLTADEMASVNDARDSLVDLYDEIEGMMGNGEGVQQANAYAIGGRISDDADDMMDYVRLLLAFQQLPQIQLAGARLPASDDNQYADVRMDEETVEYGVFQSKMKEGASPDTAPARKREVGKLEAALSNSSTATPAALQMRADRSARVLQLKDLQTAAARNPRVRRTAQLQEKFAGTPTVQRRELSQKDIEGYAATYDTIVQGLQANQLDPSDTLIVSVGRSPQVLTKYLQKRGLDVVYMPISGLSGHQMDDYGALDPTKQQNRDSFFKSFVGDRLGSNSAVLTIDVGVSGSSNFAVYKEIGDYLARQKRDDVAVKMATISPFQNQDVKEIDTSALQHQDNILRDNPLDTDLRGIHRLLKVQYNSIDKDMAFTDKFNFKDIDKGKKAPVIDKKREGEVEDILDRAVKKYGVSPKAQDRKDPKKPFKERLLFKDEVEAWKWKQEDKLWQEEHPYLTRLLKVAYYMAAFSSGAAPGLTDSPRNKPDNIFEKRKYGSLNKEYWKHIDV